LKAWEDLSNNATYTYPLNLDPGCYNLHIFDTKDDGLYWWHNSTQGSGYLRLKNQDGNILYDFEPEFGRFAEYEFGVGAITSINDISNEVFINAYPNPVNNMLHLDILGLDGRPVTISLYNAMMVDVLNKNPFINSNEFRTDMSIGHLPSGIYLLKINYGEGSVVKKIVKQ
jgi:hypothetical protein